MTAYSFVLPFAPGSQRVLLRELCAHDELAVADVSAASAVSLVNRLLLAVPDQPAGYNESPDRAAQFTTADRDRLLAAIYQVAYGSRIESTVQCPACASCFDVDFSLEELLAFSQPNQAEQLAEPAGDGTFRLADACCFRLPTGADELAVAGLPGEQAAQALLQRCLLAGDPAASGELVQQAMQAAAPLLELDMLATCPECGHPQPVHFNMQAYLLTRLRNEQPQVVRDVHWLATTYRWAYHEIAELPRRLRRLYVGFMQQEAATQ